MQVSVSKARAIIVLAEDGNADQVYCILEPTNVKCILIIIRIYAFLLFKLGYRVHIWGIYVCLGFRVHIEYISARIFDNLQAY